MSAFIDENTQFVDTGGNPIVNGKIYIGTKGNNPKTSAITIYSNRALSSVLANPQTLNSAGRSTNKIFIPDVYSFQVDNAAGVQQIQDLDAGSGSSGGLIILSSVQGTNTITATASPSVTSYVDGQIYVFQAAGANTGATTINIDSVGAKAVVDSAGALSSGDIATGRNSTLIYNATDDNFELQVTTVTTSVRPLTGGNIFITESAAASSDIAGDGQIWVDDAVPNTLMFTNDAGTDEQISGLGYQANFNGFRLTLTSDTPVTTADVSAAGTIYMTPYTSKLIGLYDGSSWQLISTAQMSVAADSGTDQVFDIFFDYNGGTPQLVTLDWTNDTTRATALVYQDGVLCKTGDLQQRYLGTARTKTGSQVSDTIAFRHLWNYYNRIDKDMYVEEPANSWTYTTATIRQANANTANQLDFVIGVDEDVVKANVYTTAYNGTQNIQLVVGVGLDSTTTMSGLHPKGKSATGAMTLVASYNSHTGIGRHFLAWLEHSQAIGSTVWTGDDNTPTTCQSGITGIIRC